MIRQTLHPTSTATTVRVRDSKTLTTDGPFIESTEALGGFYIVNAEDLDRAIGLAAQCPDAGHGAVEVRPIVDFSARRQPDQSRPPRLLPLPARRAKRAAAPDRGSRR